ncbi:unnamed protein product [Aphanomyces euteiches]
MADKPTSMGVVDDDDVEPGVHSCNSAVVHKETPAATTTAVSDHSLVHSSSPCVSPPHEDIIDEDDKHDDNDDDSTESNSSDDRDYQQHLLKPMPVLGVCPMAVLPLDKATPTMAPSPLVPPLPMNAISPPMYQPSVLKRDPMAIRQQYWTQLGINPSVRDLERSTGRRRINRAGIKVKLNDIKHKPKQNNIFKTISNWVTNERNSSVSETSEPSTPPLSSEESKDANVPSWLLQGQLTPPKIIKDSSSPPKSNKQERSIRFEDEAEMYYIPVHKELSKRQRDSMWYAREEFIAMVERNLDEMYDEMEAEYEQNAKREALENEAMAAEEARQRQIEEALKQQKYEMRPMLQVPVLKPQSIAPRGRSPAEIRIKYLKHLGI